MTDCWFVHVPQLYTHSKLLVCARTAAVYILEAILYAGRTTVGFSEAAFHKMPINTINSEYLEQHPIVLGINYKYLDSGHSSSIMRATAFIDAFLFMRA